jgi:ribosomal protein S18 acetylase RimI-like enzyme
MRPLTYELLPLTESDRDAIVPLLARYPFKEWQKRVQELDADRLARLLWDLLRQRIQRPEARGWVAWRKQPREAVGLGLVAPHPEHSRVFGLPMGRIEDLVNYVEPETVGPLLLDRLLEDARELGLGHLACRVDGHDWANVQMLEAAGFHCVDCSLKLARRLDGTGRRPVANAGVRIRPWAPADMPHIQRIAAESHTRNHFYNDPSLNRERAEALFRDWVERCARGLAHFLLVAEDKSGYVDGFVIALTNGRLARMVGVRIGIIDYIVVDREAAGRGIGRALLAEAMDRLAQEHTWVELRTSQDNYGAVGFYTAAGFRLLASDFLFHRREKGAGN